MNTIAIRVPSLTRAGKSYLVRPWRSGLACGCPRWGTGPKQTTTCKHVKLYLATMASLYRCGANHGAPAGHVCAECVCALLAAAARKVKRNYVPKPPRRSKKKEPTHGSE